MNKARPLLLAAFWLGVSFFALGQVITFYPGAEAGWFAISAALCLCGLLVRSRAYIIAALCLVTIGIVLSISGYRHGEQYRVWLSKQPSREERIHQLEEQIRMLDKTNAESGKRE
jgi:hypothetical protein